MDVGLTLSKRGDHHKVLNTGVHDLTSTLKSLALATVLRIEYGKSRKETDFESYHKNPCKR